jgi:hypothetical protein
MKIQINIEKQYLFLLVAVIAIATIGIVLAAKPNPGHSLSETNITLDCTTVSNSMTTASGYSNVEATLTSGYTRVGGGCIDDGMATGRLLTKDGPSATDANKWVCVNKDHSYVASGTNLTAYVIGCKLS